MFVENAYFLNLWKYVSRKRKDSGAISKQNNSETTRKNAFFWSYLGKMRCVWVTRPECAKDEVKQARSAANQTSSSDHVRELICGPILVNGFWVCGLLGDPHQIDSGRKVFDTFPENPGHAHWSFSTSRWLC